MRTVAFPPKVIKRLMWHMRSTVLVQGWGVLHFHQRSWRDLSYTTLGVRDYSCATERVWYRVYHFHDGGLSSGRSVWWSCNGYRWLGQCDEGTTVWPPPSSNSCGFAISWRVSLVHSCTSKDLTVLFGSPFVFSTSLQKPGSSDMLLVSRVATREETLLSHTRLTSSISVMS